MAPRELDKTPQGRRARYVKRMVSLEQDANSWRAHWQELNDWIRPRRYRYLNTKSDHNNGAKRNDKIINSAPLIAQRTLSSGMHAGISSPARPWFRLGPSNPVLRDNPAVRRWFGEVEEIMYEIIARSNIYDCLPKVYSYLGVFGTAAMIVDEDDEDVVRGYVLPIGQYFLANNEKLVVDTLYRKFNMTVLQSVRKFGYENCSLTVRNAYDEGKLDLNIEVIHVIEPNDEFDPVMADKKGMPYRSIWFERVGSADVGFLREMGYHEFPAMCPRWEVDGEDVYGSSPGMDALGDAKALQNLEKRKGQVMDKVVIPPMVGPPGLSRASLLPGDVTIVGATPGGVKFEPAMNVNPQAMTMAQQISLETERRLNEIFFADLWRMLSQRAQQEGGVQPLTAREVTDRQEEKMLQLGPVLERVHGELLEPLLNRIFMVVQRRGWMPRVPPELEDQDVKIEFVSIMAQAQKLLGTVAIERMMGFVGNIGAVQPDVFDNIDVDKTVETYAKMLGVPSECLRDAKVIQQLRDAKNQQAQAKAQGEAMGQAAQGAKTLSETDMRGDSALNRLLGAAGGGALPPV